MAPSAVRFLFARLAGGVVVVVAATAVTWLLFRLLRPQYFTHDEPVPAALGRFLTGAFLHFDFGRSLQGSTRPVGTLLREGLPADAALLVGSVVLGTAGGVAGGVLCAARPGSALSRTVQGGALLALCAPVYVVGLTALLLFGRDIAKVSPLGVIPTAYVEPGDGVLPWLGSLMVPCIVLALPLAGLLLRMMRGSLLDVEGADFVRTARAKGLHERMVLRRHALPAAAAPTLNLAGAAVPLVLANLVLVEAVFQVPGAFRVLHRSITDGDYPMILGLTAVGAAFIVLAGVVVDAVLLWLDPRLR